jgi:hypothetical protein
MKEEELRKHTRCSICGKKIGHTGLPFFWTLAVDRYGIDFEAMRRQDGLAAYLGGHTGLAEAVGPNEDMAEKVMDTVTLTLCEYCVMKQILIPALCERENADESGEEVNR